jgi:DNA (cytosine-5)-methyltransferase 1
MMGGNNLKLKIMDLFAGAGGLSNGFEQTNKFEVKIAVEINPNARKTYKKNHENATMVEDITEINYEELKEQYGKIDIIIGGPPCQGFSNANRQKNTLISSNNQLVKEYLRAIEEVRPKAFILENVRTMDSQKHKFYLKVEDEEQLVDLTVDPIEENITIGKRSSFSEELVGFILNYSHNQINLSQYLLNKDVFSKLNSLLRHLKNSSNNNYILFLNKDTNKRLFDKLLEEKIWYNTHMCYWNENYRLSWNDLRNLIKDIIENKDTEIKELSRLLEDILETQRVLNKMNEVFKYGINFFGLFIRDNDLIIKLKTYNVFNFIKLKLKKLGYEFNENKHIFNAAQFGVPQERRRLVLIGVLKEELKTESIQLPEPIVEEKDDYYKIFDAIGDLESVPPNVDVKESEIFRPPNPILNSKLNRYLNNSNDNILYNHVRTDSSEIAIKRFKALHEGQNFHNLDESLKTTYSDHKRTQNTIYKRLTYDEPSDTVLNVRKSMWIHPKLNRAISIREAARLQSFQDSYRFYGSKDSQYQQIGNAVPPLLARSIAESLLKSLGIEVEEKIQDILARNEDIEIEDDKENSLILT